MTARTGFYTVIQYHPDPYRGEGVNVGVVVADGAELRVRMAMRNEHVKRTFGAASFDDLRLTADKEALQARLCQVSPTRDAVRDFVSQESGQLALWQVRPMVVDDIDADTARLFESMVSDPYPRTRDGLRGPSLEADFLPLSFGRVPLERNVRTTIPVIDEPFKADYAYRNGRRNLIKSIKFPDDPDASFKAAQQLGSKGLLLYKHPVNNTEQALIVVGKMPDHESEIRTVLRDHNVRLVNYAKIKEFVAEIERTAHS